VEARQPAARDCPPLPPPLAHVGRPLRSGRNRLARGGPPGDELDRPRLPGRYLHPAGAVAFGASLPPGVRRVAASFAAAPSTTRLRTCVRPTAATSGRPTARPTPACACPALRGGRVPLSGNPGAGLPRSAPTCEVQADDRRRLGASRPKETTARRVW